MSRIYKKSEFSVDELAKLKGDLLGLLLSRGYKSRALKSYDSFCLLLKKKTKRNVNEIMDYVFNKLKPIFLLGVKQIGKRFVSVPILSGGNKRNVIIMTWLFRQLKGKMNTRGVNLEQLVDAFFETNKNRGNVLKQQSDYYKRGVLNRHFMWKSKLDSNKLQSKMIRKKNTRRVRKKIVYAGLR